MDRFFSHLIKQPFTSVWISLGFVIGCIATVFYYQTLEFVALTILVLIVSAYFKPFLNVLLGFICAIFCITLHFNLFYDFELPKKDKKYAYSSQLVVEDVISSQQPQYVKVKILKLEERRYLKFRAPSAMLSINSNQSLFIGATFEASIHLKPFRTTKNFSVFDNQRYAFTQRIFYKGKVLNKNIEITNTQQNKDVLTYRQFIKQTFDNTQLQWLYYGLLTGDKSLMSDDDKKLMQTLGLSHMLAISGLHISLVFVFGFVFSRFILSAMCHNINTRQTINVSKVYSLIGFLGAFFYVYLSDFLLSATRALIMLGCYILLYYLAKQAFRWRSILYALVLVLIINPFNTLNPGLYFSFLAVVIIFLVNNKIPIFKGGVLSNIAALVVIQVALFIGLLPLSLYFFNGVSLAGLILNLIAIPLLSFVIMPALIAFSLLSTLVDISIFILFFDNILAYFFKLLVNIPLSIRWLNTGEINIQLVVYFYLSLTLFYFLPLKWLSGIPVSILLVDYLLTEKPNWQLHVFDVGHGLMVLIQRNEQALVYDFGPSYFNRFSRTRSILLPFIEANKLQVDKAILSHEDNDHAGGIKHFIEAGFNSTLQTFHPYNLQDVCHVTRINFYGLNVESFASSGFNNENDDSCVLRIASKSFSVLLSGDISTQREAELIARHYKLNSTVLISPHHGSNTSSSIEFINYVKPEIVIHSSAYQGQWTFPNHNVVERYNEINAKQYITGQEGQVTIEFYNNNMLIKTAREQESYWFIKN